MAENTNIEWATHTFNPWIGCTKVSPACSHCYAENYGKRFNVRWGKGEQRRRTSKANWRKTLSWNNKAEALLAYHRDNSATIKAAEEELGETFPPPKRPRVFCGSLCDWLDPEVPAEWLADLLALIDATPHLDWLLLTKRPELWGERLAAAHRASGCGNPHDAGTPAWVRWSTHGEPLANAWLGFTAENQEWFDKRWDAAKQIPARLRFLSCEPLLGPLDFGLVEDDEFHWIICGGESGPKARPMHPGWARFLRDQCRAAEVPFLFKQWGEWAPAPNVWPDVPRSRRQLVGKGRRKAPMARVGKKAAGRLLDGVLHNEFPEVR